MEFTSFEAFMLALGAMGLGIILLVRGGNWTVDSSVYIATHFGISPLLVGFTIVAFGTSLPEMVISVLANFQGSPGIAIGNVIGSNIANTLLIIGVSAFFGSMYVVNKAINKDLIMMMVASVILLGLMTGEVISPGAGLAMLFILISYVVYQYRVALKEGHPAEEEEGAEFANKYLPYLYLILGLGAIALGAEFLVRGAKVSATVLGVPESVIALSIIAFGTSLPELSTCIVAARRGHSGIVLGNIIGSNVFNVLMILGVTAAVMPIDLTLVAQQLFNFDIWFMLCVSAIFAALLMVMGKISRPIGALFLLAYLGYNVYIYALHMF